jgi:acyl transferase domain-containing protein
LSCAYLRPASPSHIYRLDTVQIKQDFKFIPMAGIHSEPLAIIGLACRLPQDATNIEDLWKLLLESRSAATPIPSSKFNVSGHYHPDPERGGSIYTQTGHFLTDSTEPFDAPFFNLSKAEVLGMDPQQRLVLETFIMLLKMVRSNPDFHNMLNLDPEIKVKFRGTGTSTTILANRISWFYNFRGTSLTIDTACSSSLTALHQACNNLRLGESEMVPSTRPPK